MAHQAHEAAAWAKHADRLLQREVHLQCLVKKVCRRARAFVTLRRPNAMV